MYVKEMNMDAKTRYNIRIDLICGIRSFKQCTDFYKVTLAEVVQIWDELCAEEA